MMLVSLIHLADQKLRYWDILQSLLHPFLFLFIDAEVENRMSPLIPQYKNLGEDCWGGCSRREGLCGWCGYDGHCCRKGRTGDGCDGQMGGANDHICVKKA